MSGRVEPPLLQARRLGPVALDTPDLEGQIGYYTDVLGLQLVTSTADKAVLATREGIECVVLQAATAAGLVGVSFELAPDSSLDTVCATLDRAGIRASIGQGRTPGTDAVVAFTDPDGMAVELFAGLRLSSPERRHRGIGPLKLGHVARVVESPRLLAEFYASTLGFRWSDWCGEEAIFLRCGPDHHTINFFRGKRRLQHLAFQVKDWSELARAADALRSWGLALDWGPARHHIGHNMACYHSNSDAIRIELFCEMDQVLDEALGYFDPRPWHEDRPQRPKDWGPTPRNAWIPGVP